MTINESALARLKSQLARGEIVLFTGAGFSSGAKDRTGLNVPGSTQLAEELWSLSFPDRPFDIAARLGDIVEAARRRNRRGLAAALERRLSVDPASIPDSYRIWFSAPWRRCYTLNVDNIEVAVSNRFDIPRSIRSFSATTTTDIAQPHEDVLEVVHLNGMVGDALDSLTFSEFDYGLRQTQPDAWFSNCTADILSKPVVFVGTELREPTIWQYLSYRQSKGVRGTHEYRPGSYLVVPKLDAARILMLDNLNITHVPLDAEGFAEILASLTEETARGLRALGERVDSAALHRRPSRVSELVGEKARPDREYLLGDEPTWSDLTEGIAAVRQFDTELADTALAALRREETLEPVLITGTAGSGKSTSLMSLGLRLTAAGIPSYWIDETFDIRPAAISEIPRIEEGPVAILIDDIDLWGGIGASWIRDIPPTRPSVLLVAALRSARVEGRFDSTALGGVRTVTAPMPPLDDGDIRSILATLKLHNRLGVLRGMSTQDQVQAFKMKAGRQLLVAMIEATSGVSLREKVYEEFSQLQEAERLLYAIVCVVTSQRYSMDREGLLLAVGDATNSTLNALESLVRSHLITRETIHAGYQARHRVIADEVVTEMRNGNLARQALSGICFMLATRVRRDTETQSRPFRQLIRFINHDYLFRMAGAETARDIYQDIESLLSWDYQYWLQRGSLELENDGLSLAENFLGQARSMASGHPQVETAYAHLLLKKAAAEPSHPEAPQWYDNGKRILTALIASSGRTDSYAYHILGSQTISWVRREQLTREASRDLLGEVRLLVREGVRNHPSHSQLRRLEEDLGREWLMTAVSE